MCHWIHKFFQDYTNDELWLTLTIFGKKMADFMECFEDFGLKIDLLNCLYECIKACE